MTEMQKPCVEKIREFWQTILPAFHYEAWPEDLFLATMCVHISRAIQLLIRGDVHGARVELWRSEHLLRCSKTAAEEPEIFRQSLHILDIGWFAWSLAAYSRFGWAVAGDGRCFCDILEVAKEIWYARETFAPYLSDALRAASIFMSYPKSVPAGRAFRIALNSSNFYANMGYSIVHGNKPIGHLLGSAAISKLKELFRVYVLARKSGAGRSPSR